MATLSCTYLCWNIDGVKQKLDFHDVVNYLKSFHIIGLLETWETSSDMYKNVKISLGSVIILLSIFNCFKIFRSDFFFSRFENNYCFSHYFLQIVL